ncbi:DUF308 domain-containing protein [Ruminococcus sp.]|uniref:DUF308 domain-containing protein n=1 Tax=Ruminococcus sp. TaxID=41978 RepID=UPI00386B4067
MAKFKNLIPTIIMLIFELVIGVLLIINGEKVTQVVFILFGVLMLVCGIISLIASLLRSRNGGELSMSQLVLSIILIGIGAFFTAASGSVMSVVSSFTLIIGIIMAFNGILKLVEFFTIRRAGSVAWFAAVGAIVTIILGLVIAFNPFGATRVMWTVNGILIIVSAVFDIISLIIFGAAMKKMPPITRHDVINTKGKEVK